MKNVKNHQCYCPYIDPIVGYAKNEVIAYVINGVLSNLLG
jgi:hypothetical protein